VSEKKAFEFREWYCKAPGRLKKIPYTGLVLCAAGTQIRDWN
jgi:hypothetical protein